MSSRKRNSRRWIILVAAMLVAALALGNLVALHLSADRFREAGITLDRVEEQILRLRSMQQQTESRPELAQEIGARTAEVRYRMADALGRLETLAPEDPAPAELRRLLSHYFLALDPLFAQRAGGRPREIAIYVRDEVEPAYGRILAQVAEMRQAFGHDAERTNMAATIGSLLVLFGAMALIPVLFGRLERVRLLAERRQAEKMAAAQGEQRLQALLQHAHDAILVISPNGKVQYADAAVERLAGYDPAWLAGAGILSLLHPDDLPTAQEFVLQVQAAGGAPVMTEARFRHADGAWRLAEAVGSNLLADPAVAGILITCRDITERKEMEEQLRHLAYHDPLTHLPNRAHFMAELERALASSDDSRPVGLLFLDIDNFKLVNDSLGHQTGDELVLAVAERLRTVVGPDDLLGHLGGDEFVVLLRMIKDAGEAEQMAARLLEQFQAPFILPGHELFCGFSLGVAINGPGYDEPASLLRAADLAMYGAKTSGKGRYQKFDPCMDERLQERLELQNDLRRAIERAELRLYYQPIVNLREGRVSEVEALVRWQHPRRGLLSPAAFISLAEETGLILPLGRWVLREACNQASRWQAENPGGDRLSISVNLSARQLADPHLAADVAAALQESGLSPSSLKLEITESIMMQDVDSTLQTLTELKRLGIHLAIDDFGTGYSSLGYLKRFPVDVLKIDRSFVDRLGRDPDDGAIVGTIISLAKTLKLQVTGEGIETAEQLQELQTLGCDMGQGYLFAHPVPPAEVSNLLQGVLEAAVARQGA